ncbi:MAG: type-F conjugative transfer system secretin TraK [Prevotella sp.]|jgi:hypothetical protein|nr:type-F conjugative transfer system secretin TraK [Prevotella sp.]
MKTKTFIFIAALFAATALHAQQISVVAPGGATALYTSLDDAITGAETGSTIYLSGGGFQIKDETKITKKLTIIGIGHRVDNDNADGHTNVSGSIFFEDGSDNSALMGVYLSGNVNIGTGQTAVNSILVRYCNVNSIQVRNSSCQGILINQNYIRSQSSGGDCAITFSNNIMHSVGHVTGGVINHNMIRHTYYHYNTYYSSVHYYYCYINTSTITNNIFRDAGSQGSAGSSNNQISNNIDARSDAGGDHSTVPDDWDDVFVGPDNGVNPTSNFALKGSIGKNGGNDGTDIGIYGGTGFSNTALPPIPRIVAKTIAERTDENGKLKIKVRIKAQ